MADTKKELEEILDILLKVAESQNFANFEINPNTEANSGDGFTSQFYTGEITSKDTGDTVNVAIKKASSLNYREMFKNEDAFYRIICPTLNDIQNAHFVSKPFNNVPKYFRGGLELGKEYIAMENLTELGYVMFDKKEYLSREHIELIFKTYGKFHALSYVLRKNHNEKYRIISKELTVVVSPVMKYVEKQMITAVSATINALDPDKDKIIYDEIYDFGPNVVTTFSKVSKYNGDYRCLVHGDCWSNNMLFKYSESGNLLDIKLLDFQFCKESTPIHDLSYFFYSGVAKKDMDNLDYYLQVYHNSFTEIAKEIGANPDDMFSFEVLKNEWKENARFGIILGIYLWQAKLVLKKDITDILDTTQKQKLPKEEAAILWEVVLNRVVNTDLFKEKTTAILRHAVEYGIIDKNKIIRN